MNESEPGSNEPAADTANITRRRRRRISPVWLIPLGAALIGAWLLYQNVVSKGPEITLTIDSAEGLEAGSTQIKVRSVEVGHVTGIKLADDYQGAVVTARMDPDMGDLLAGDSRFWVVKPRVGRQGVSGLGTLLSGAYIQLQPGKSDQHKSQFKIRDSAPAVSIDEPGVSVRLTSSDDNSLAVGDPIIYQGQTVGQIEAATFSLEHKQMQYQIFVREPYSGLITDATQFWLRSGIDFHLGSDGVDVQLGSLQSVLAGGITFGLPAGIEAGEKAAEGARYTLYQTRNAAVQDRFDQKVEYVVMLNESIRGLSAGAPVEFRGLRVGTVEAAPFYKKGFEMNQFRNFRIPVLVSIEPQRPALAWAGWGPKEWRRKNDGFFTRGLRATIKTSNLLTGSMFISLSFDQSAAPWKKQMIGGYEVFPSMPSQITNIQQQITNLVNKLNGLDLTPIVEQLKQTVNTSNDTLNQLNQAIHRINGLLSTPGTRELPGQLVSTLQSLQNTLDNFQQGGPGYQQISRSLQRLNQILDNAAPLVQTLRNHPNALIFDHSSGRDPEPRARP